MSKFPLLLIILTMWCGFLPEFCPKPKIGGPIEVIKSNNYPLETHEVVTDDGYILTMYRVPYGKNTFKNRPPVLLMHGFIISCMEFLIQGPNKSVALILADAGYDVWLGNFRGNTFSRRHIVLDPDIHKDKFFNYSYHEWGTQDIPAMINYILDNTGYRKLSYIGYSQGVTSFLVMASERPEYNDKIALIHAYAPILNLYNMRSIYFNVLARFPILLELAKFIGWYEMFSVKTAPIFRMVCQSRILCNAFLRSLGCSEWQMPDHEFQLKSFSNMPAGTTLKQIYHLVQGTRTGIFGTFGDMRPYNLTKVTAPIIVYYADNDMYINNEELLNNISKLSNVLKVFKVPNFDHLDFVWGTDTKLLTDETLKNQNDFYRTQTN